MMKKCKVILVDDVPTKVRISATSFVPEEKVKYNRAKKKAEDREKIEKGYEKWLDREE